MTSSSSLKLSQHDLKAARFISDVREEIQVAYLDELQKRRLKKSDIARSLGVNRSVVSRLLNGTAPLELRSIAYLAAALGRNIVFRLPERPVALGSNIIPMTASNNTAPEATLNQTTRSEEVVCASDDYAYLSAAS